MSKPNRDLDSYLEQQAKLLKINLEDENLSKNEDSLRLYKGTLIAITESLFDDDQDLGDIPKMTIKEVLRKDVNKIINGLRNYSGKNRKGIKTAWSHLDKAVISLSTASKLFSDDAEKIEARVALLVQSRNSLLEAIKQLTHIKT